MKEKDLFDLFKDNQHKLSEQPSERSWRRLERKLDTHRQRGRFTFYRHFAMAAALLALVVFTALISFWLGKQQTLQYADLPAHTPAAFEQLEAENVSQTPEQITQFQKQYEAKDNEIAEGSQGQKLQNAKVVNLKLKKDNVEVQQGQFGWLLGDWKGNSPNGLSLEEWTKTEDGGLQAKAELQINDKSVFSEKMRLYQKNEQWFFELLLAKDTPPVTYQLKSYQNYRAIFENDAISFPNQLILQRYSDNKFSTILQNKVEEKAALTAAQKEFLHQRNVVTEERIIRNLVMVE